MAVATGAMIGAVVTYLAKKLKDNKSVNDFFSDFTGATVDWLRPVFLTDDDEVKEVVRDLAAEPNDELNINDTKNKIAKTIKRNPNLETSLKALYDEIVKKEGNQFAKHNTMNVTGDGNISFQDVKGNISIDKSIKDSKNVNTGNINTGGGDFRIGDGN
ncbi:MAG: hypothetical protein ACPG5B_00830 [Chitinophagales bacterium]